jgi:hypothetical protein
MPVRCWLLPADIVPINLPSMPTVLREKGFRFFFYMADRYEPPHIHVSKEQNAAKFWLDPLELAFNDGFRDHELSDILRIIEAHMDELFATWYKCFGKKFGDD